MFPFGLIPTALILMLGAAILICLPAYCGVKIIKMSRAQHPDFENWIESLGLETFRLALLVSMAILWLAALVGLILIAAYVSVVLPMLTPENGGNPTTPLPFPVTQLALTGLGLLGLAIIPYILIQRKKDRRKQDMLDQELIARRIDNAVQSLNSTLPEAQCSTAEIGARIGAVHALGRIAAESDRHHLAVLELLCDYLRQHTMAARLTATAPQAPWQGPLASHSIDMDDPAEKIPPPSVIQSVISVMGKRDAWQIAVERMPKNLIQPYRIDLRNIVLKGADMVEIDLAHCLMDNSQLDHATLNHSNLDGADLRGASLRSTQLWKTSLRDAQLWTADLTEADLREANLQRADLSQTKFLEANLTGTWLVEANLHHADLSGADLENANLENALLGETNLQGADLGGANLQGANLDQTNLRLTNLEGVRWDNVINLASAHLNGASMRDLDATDIGFTQYQLNQVFTDASLIQPAGLQRPGHWPDSVLDDAIFHTERRLWLSDPTHYLPPQDRDPHEANPEGKHLLPLPQPQAIASPETIAEPVGPIAGPEAEVRVKPELTTDTS